MGQYASRKATKQTMICNTNYCSLKTYVALFHPEAQKSVHTVKTMDSTAQNIYYLIDTEQSCERVVRSDYISEVTFSK